MKRVLILIFFFFTIVFHAQTIKIAEKETLFPIENVTIYNESKTKVVYSNKKGEADLSGFLDNEVLSFNHISYIEFEVLKRDLKKLNHRILLIRNAEQLDEVILSVSRSEVKRSRIAEQIVTTKAEEIEKLSPQTTADLLSNLAGIKVQKTQFGGGSPVLRGMEANRVLLVVDGVRMNNAIYRTGHLQNSITVSPLSLDRAEIVFGPSSVIYGSDALGGVIHYYTKTPKIATNFNSNVALFSRYSSVNDEFTYQANVELQSEKIASYTSFSRSDFGNLKMGKNRNHGFEDWGKVLEYSNNTATFFNDEPVVNKNETTQKNTGYNQFDVLQKFYIPITDKTDVTLNMQYSESSVIPRFDKYTEYSDDKLKYAEWDYGPQKRLLISSQLQFNPNKKWIQNGTLTAAYQNIKESRIQRKFESLERSYRDENIDVFSLNGDFSMFLTRKKDRKLSYGFEFVYNDVESKSIGKTLEVDGSTIIGFTDDFAVQSRYPDGGSNYMSSAAYANYRQDISRNATLNTGIRYTFTILNATWIDDTFLKLPDNDISLDNSAVTATIGYILKPSESLQLNTVLSSGFRSPNIDDVGKIREKSGDVTVPNIYLNPEYAYNIEAGILKYFNQKKYNIGFTAYYTLLDNYISRSAFTMNNSATIEYDGELGNIVANTNQGNAFVKGCTLSSQGKISTNWYTKGSATYTKGKTKDTNEPLSSIPPLFGNIEFGYVKNNFEASVNFKFNSRKKIEDYNLIEGIDNETQTPFISSTNQYYGTPSWSTFNFFSKYSFSKKIDLQVSVDNIFDIHYKEFASAISAPGRNISLSATIKL